NWAFPASVWKFQGTSRCALHRKSGAGLAHRPGTEDSGGRDRIRADAGRESGRTATHRFQEVGAVGRAAGGRGPACLDGVEIVDADARAQALSMLSSGRSPGEKS